MKIITKNKRAIYDYEIKERFICGMVLLGAEVKSIRSGQINLKGSYVIAKSEELYLVGAHISPYKFAKADQFDPLRSRKLLLHRKQINQIVTMIHERGIAVVPIAVGLENGMVKLEIGVGRGKRQYDKREVIKRRTMLREAQKEVKSDRK